MSKSQRILKFEEAMQRLTAIVEAIEAGEIGIEDSISKYEEAMTLAGHCRRILDDAELRIQKIQTESGDQLKVTPFDAAKGGTDDETNS